MDSKAMAVLAVVAIVAVGGIACFVFFGGGSGSGEKYAIDGTLNVYGNADRDYKIDNADLKIIKDVKDGKATLEDYPFADANCSGAVDDDDVALVEKILKNEPCTVYFVNVKKTAGEYISTVKWPIESAIATGSSNNLLLFTFAGINEKIHGIARQTPDWGLFPYYKDVTQLNTTTTKITLDMANDTIKQYNVTALISDYTDSTISNEQEFRDNGIDVIRVSAAVTDPDKYASQLLLMSFMFNIGDDAHKKALEFAEWNTKVLKDIKTKTAAITDKHTAIVTSSGLTNNRIWISAGTSDYRDVVEVAGAQYAIGDNFDIYSISGYTSGAYYYHGDTWLYNLNPEYIIAIADSTYYSGTVDVVSLFENRLQLFDETQAYENKNIAVVMGNGPVTMRVAYCAALLYPEVFTMEWANNLHKEMMEKFFPGELDLDGKFFVITYDDYIAAKNKATA